MYLIYLIYWRNLLYKLFIDFNLYAPKLNVSIWDGQLPI